MFVTLFITVVSLVIFLFYYKWKKVRNYWADRGVPHSPPHPILGSLRFLLKMNGLDYFVQEYQKHKPSPYFGIWLFWRPALVVRDPELVKRVMVKDFDVFKDRFASIGEHDLISSKNIFFANEPLWSSVRRKLTSVFSSSKLRALHPLNLKKAKDLVTRIKNENAKGNPIVLREVLTDLTTDTIAAASFGVDDDATLTGDSPMRRITNDFQQYSIWRAMAWASIFFMPEMTSIFGFTFFPKSSSNYFRKVFAAAVEQRGGWHKQNAEVKDLLDALLNIKRQAILDGEEISDDLLVSQAALFLQAGYETTGVILTYLIYELAHNPDIQQKLYEEVKEAKDKLGDEDFNPQVLAELKYLNSCIKETMRRYPGIGFLDRIATTDYKVDDKLTIPKGTPVFSCIGGLHLDPEYWPEPKKFDPERFMPENDGKNTPFTNLPFGEGPRNCIGLRLGRQTMCYTISYMMLAFTLSPSPGMPKPIDITFEKNSTLALPGVALTVEFTPRNLKDLK